MRKSDSLFFLSGAAALVYQTVWIRLLARLLGSDAGGLAIVLAVFMGGMALGAFTCAGLVRRSSKPVQLFARLEIALGVWAAASPFLFDLVDPTGNGFLRLTLAVSMLLVPTWIMGATFPLMARLTIRDASETGSETSAFYGANTLGAAFGALLGPLVLMPFLGLTAALLAAAVLDVLVGVLALRWFAALDREGEPDRAPAAPRLGWSAPLLLGTFLVGFCGLGLEVVLARLLVTVTGSSVYAYAIVLGVFLTGIGFGSRQLVSRRGEERALRADANSFQLVCLALPALTLLGLLALRWQLGEDDLFGPLQNRMPVGTGVLQLWASHALLAALALLPPALALGAALPAAAAGFAAKFPDEAREPALARVYTMNTAGALCGTLCAGFLLLPKLGTEFSLLALLVCPLVAGILVRNSGPSSVAKRGGLALAAFLLGAFLLHGESEESSDRELLYLQHGSHATVSVEETDDPRGGRVRALRVNGKVVATTAPVDLRLQRLLGHIPGLLHGDVKRAVVIGCGTGMTAGSLLDLPTLEHLDLFEISAAVPGGARQFAPWNGGVVDDARTHLRTVDGRHALATSEDRWDLITSDPIHPWTRGSSDLYALEHFRNMAEHLAEGGVASQWLPLYQLSTLDVRTVIATWCAAFPNASAWLTAYDLALVGSVDPLPGFASGPGAIGPHDLASHLAEAGLHGWAELEALQVADDRALREYVTGIEPMTDDRPVLEFRAPFSFLGGYATEVLDWAGRDEFVDKLPERARERARDVRHALDEFLRNLPNGWTVAARLYGERLLALPASRADNP